MRILTKREKLLLAVLAVLALIVLINYIIIPVISSIGSVGDDKGTTSANIQKLNSLADEFRRTRQEKTQLLSMLDAKNENTVTVIQQIATTNNIDKNISNTRRSQQNIQNKYIRITTEVRIEGVAIQPLIKFLADIENSGGLVRIQSLRISKGLKGTDAYDSVIKIDSFTNK
jgi:hypothetical protein